MTRDLNLPPEASAGSPAAGNHLQSVNGCLACFVRAAQELSQARSVERIREIVRHAARDLTGADGATVILRDGDKCHYVDEDAIAPLWKGMHFPMETCISGWAMLNGQPAVIPDIYVDPRIPADAYRPTFVKSLVMVPIRKAAPLGAIGNYWASHHEASAEEVELLQALADTTAVAMENAQVYTELEKRVQERTRELEVTNKELEAFSYSVSHDLRTPLRHIQGFLGLLEQECNPGRDDSARSYFDNIRIASARMGQLIDGLLGLSKVSRQEMHRSWLDLNAVVGKVVEGLGPETEGRSIQWRLAPLPTVRGDEVLLRAAFQNLLGNAVKFTGHQPEAVIEVGTQEEGGSEWTIFVKDNGAGFDPVYVHRLFGAFQRLHREDEFEGTGVGLANVQRIVHRHGGRVLAEGSPGLGATFYITLPKEDDSCR